MLCIAVTVSKSPRAAEPAGEAEVGEVDRAEVGEVDRAEVGEVEEEVGEVEVAEVADVVEVEPQCPQGPEVGEVAEVGEVGEVAAEGSLPLPQCQWYPHSPGEEGGEEE